jgi:negative regulator of sigma-B (phosphoserine phosphatase)
MGGLTMSAETAIAPPLIAWGVASRALPGQVVSGDLHLVTPTPDGVLVAAVDGLGHGAEATAAARIAIGVLQRYAGLPLVELINRCHEALIKTRGVVMTVATVRSADDQFTWLGVIHGVISNCAYKAVVLRCGYEATED